MDQARIASLRELDDGGSGVLAKVVQLFTSDMPGRVLRLRQAVDRGDLDGVRLAAHSVRGSVATAGARVMAELCGQLEQAAETGDLSDAQPLVVAIEQQLELVARALAREVGDEGAGEPQ